MKTIFGLIATAFMLATISFSGNISHDSKISDIKRTSVCQRPLNESDKQPSGIFDGLPPADYCREVCSWGGLSLPPDEYDKCFWECMARLKAL